MKKVYSVPTMEIASMLTKGDILAGSGERDVLLDASLFEQGRKSAGYEIE